MKSWPVRSATNLRIAFPPEGDALVRVGADELRRGAVAAARHAVALQDVVLGTGALATSAGFQQAQRRAPAVVLAGISLHRLLPQWVVHLSVQ